MSLPAAWVDRIFDKLTVVYGRDFLSRWEGQDMNTVKSDWSHELSGFFTHPDAIAFALSNLPDRAPSVIEFKRIARQSRPPEVPRIEVAVKADPERIAQALTRLAKPPAHDERAWAHELLQRHRGGDKRPLACVVMARAVVEGRC